MTLEEAQAKILELSDSLKDKEIAIQDLEQFKEKYEEEKLSLDNTVEELRKSNKSYFERLMAQDQYLHSNNKEEEEKQNDKKEEELTLEELALKL